MATDGTRPWHSGPTGDGDRWVLRLYVAGSSPRSQRAVRNLLRFCHKHLADRADVEVVDLYQQGHRAKEAQIVGAPTLIKEEPPPRLRIVGDLSDETKVRDRLMVTAE